jgi:hypothetical protein
MPERVFVDSQGIRPLIPARAIDPKTKLSIEVIVGVIPIEGNAYVTGPTGFYTIRKEELRSSHKFLIIDGERSSAGLDLEIEVELLREAMNSYRGENHQGTRPKSQFCRQGHDKVEVGMTKKGQCNECRRIWQQKHRAQTKDAKGRFVKAAAGE